jgi:HEAT repeats
MEFFSSPESVPQASVVEVLTGLLNSDPQKFRIFFCYLRDTFPNEACQVCVRYLGRGEHDLATVQHIQAWLKGSKYFGFLVDSQFLAIEEARRAAEALRIEDSRFFLNFSRLTVDGTTSQEQHARVARALALLDGLKDYSVLFSWLRGLTACADERIRSQAVKVFCKLRSNKALILRQLEADDGRVRANALEALWPLHTPEATAIFRKALGDDHHRVVVNALIGLYRQNDPSALDMLLAYAGHASELHRVAVVWAVGYLEEAKGVPVLEKLAVEDSSELVRQKASKVLAALSAKQSAAVAA